MGRLLIVGTGRSGTRFAANLLAEAGLCSGHEQVFTFPVALRGEVPDWGEAEVESSWLAVPVLPWVSAPVALLARHPLAVARSMTALGWFADDLPKRGPGSGRRDIQKIVYRFRPEVAREQTAHDRALAMWIAWNLAALPYALEVLRLEELVPGKLLGLAGSSARLTPDQVAQVRDCPERRNAQAERKRQGEPLCWASFRPPLAQAARATARLLGY